MSPTTAKCKLGTFFRACNIVSKFFLGVRISPTNKAKLTFSGNPNVVRELTPGANSCKSTPLTITRIFCRETPIFTNSCATFSETEMIILDC